MGRQGDAAEAEPLHIASNGARRHGELLGKVLESHAVTVGTVEVLDQCLLAFHAPQRQVTIPRGGCEPGDVIHQKQPKDDTGVSGFVSTLQRMSELSEEVDRFFESYQAALLARDAHTLAQMYAVPSLIVFPDNLVPVDDVQQTEDFFASSWGQYDGVEELERQTRIMARGSASVWVDVTWVYHGRPQERFCYQLVQRGPGYQIAVLTPLQ